MLRADEESQFWMFYQKTADALSRKAYRMCRGHQADAEDAHQRTYIRALEHWPLVSGLADQQRGAWLATTLAREVLQIWRAPHRWREVTADDDASHEQGVVSVASDTDAVFAADHYHEVCRGIAQLPRRQREVIALHCLAGHEVFEVAEMLGIRPSTVRVHLRDGRRRLAETTTRQEETS